ncbi:MAG: hypothetical protein NWS66_01145 [Saprospiraceae bacterium]|nr:hypothetical protein [Saprospiraceae bacterium]MDP4698521.1 hypothetical protein [Saprospiraceae bacterium]MDP4812341.1 hypothetical protein [Saprospiraceae bacterium]MDP4813933.1 hypothetical protein [Saprospiraceae bacterium]MDP4915384.1 hypothetical protein [Saprospiraceae bacterium]
MKAKIFSLFLLVFSVISLNAALPPMKVATTDATIQLSSEDLMALTPAKYQELTGEKLGLKGKLALYLLKKEVKKTGTTEPIQLVEELANNDGGFNLIGFLAGFLLSIIGVLLVFLLASNNKAMKRSAWLGFGIMVLLALLGIVL